MIDGFKRCLRYSNFVRYLIRIKGAFVRPKPQNNEAEILASLLTRYDIPKCFIEFGFSGWEFNCASLTSEWEGLLLDGDAYNVTVAKTLFAKRVQSHQLWITLETLKTVLDYADGRQIGILSIDVDGNDYWFLERLISLRPAMIISEYNSVLGLLPVTVPYDPEFDRRNFGDGWYFGASLAAIAGLAYRNGYSLIAQTSGVNAFFIRNDLIREGDVVLSPEDAYEARYSEKWKEIMHLPFVTVAGPAQMLQAEKP